MCYSPILVLVLITILSLSGTYSERYPRDYRKSYYERPLNDEPQDEVVDIGNGNYRKNVVILGPGDSQPEPLGNRFNADPTRQRTYTTNIGNGNHNHNIIGFEDSGRANVPETSDPNSGGTSFVLKNNKNGLDVFNVGYGKDNQNQLTIDGRPIQPGGQQSSQVEAQLKTLLNLSTQLQQILNELIQEAEKLNI